MKAQEYFEQVRETVLEIERSKDMLARYSAMSDLKAQSYEPRIGGNANDGLDKVNRRLQFEQRLAQRIDESYAMLDEATALLYGEDNGGGLAKLKGNKYADAVCMFYCQGMTWGEVADVMQCSEKWCRELSSAAFAYIDEIGFAHCKEG